MKYFGVRWGNIKLGLTPSDDLGKRYFTSGKFQTDFKADPAAFEFTVRNTFDSPCDAVLHEERVLTRLFKRPDWINQSCGSAIYIAEHDKVVRFNPWRKKTDEELAERSRYLSELARQRWADPEWREYIIERQRHAVRRPISEQSWNNILQALVGRVVSQETRDKISASNRGKPKKRTSEHNQKIRESHQGKTHDWQDKINKNPDKIRKTAEKNRGKKAFTSISRKCNRCQEYF